MTDEKKGPEEGEMDWESALSDWESKSFVPEVAKDVVTDKPAALSGHTVSRPLYRPPKVPPPRPKSPTVPAPPLPPRTGGPADDAGGSGVASAIPRDAFRTGQLPAEARAKPKDAPKPPRPPPAVPSRGGLGQFFARGDRRPPPNVKAGEGAQDDARSKSVTRAKSQLSDDIVTSAPSVPSRADRSGVGPLRPPTDREGVDGDLFDPFTEPRAEQLTVPADSEISDLLDAPGDPGPPRVEGALGDPKAGTSTTTSKPGPPDEAFVSVSFSEPTLVASSPRDDEPEEETLIAPTSSIAAPPASVAPASGPRSERRRTTSPPLPAALALDEFGTSGRNDTGNEGPEIVHEQSWEDERPASEWLDDAARDAFIERAGWLEEEARAVTDVMARGRALLACSEMLATVGERARAETLAAEARDIAPALALAHRQTRALMPVPSAPGALVEAFDLEIQMTGAPALAHSILLSAEAAAADGDDEDALARLDHAARAVPTDVRAAVGRAARALASPNVTAAGALRFSDVPQLAGLAEAYRLCIRLRGGRAPDAGATRAAPNELLMRSRHALDKGDVSKAASLVAELARIPELAGGALWLAASLGAPRGDRRPQATEWLRELVDRGEEDARRPLAARALESSDAELLAQSVDGLGELLPAERLVLATLSGVGAFGPAAAARLASTAAAPEMDALVAAASALALPVAADSRRREHARVRATQTVGSPETRALLELGRELGASGLQQDVEAALRSIEASLEASSTPKPPMAQAVALEMAARGGRFSEVSATLEAWGAARATPEEQAVGALAAAIVAERAGDAPRALQAYRAARAADGTSEAALRAVAALEQVDLVAEMNALADELGDGVRAAMARIEAVTLGERLLPEPTQAHLLETAHRAAPALPIASFLAERIARRSGDVEEVLRWIRDRRAQTTDSTDSALDAVREALLVAGRDPALTIERLREAHQIRPSDVALRDLYERMVEEPPEDRAAWRESRAAEAIGDARKLLLLDAALEYERRGDEDSALRCAEKAAALDTSLGRVARERAELRTGRVARLADELFSQAKEADDPRRRREAYERLADLDFNARHDPGSALLWHRSIFEEQPDYKPSLRYLEQHLVGEGRDEELEPIASGIALALRGTGSAETVAHAELAARLRMRGAAGSWEATRPMVEVAAAEREPSLWSLRMLQSHSRTSGDDEGFLAVTKRLVERASRPLEVATLLVRAGEAAGRLGRAEESRSLLERAAEQDPGDVVAWDLLVHARKGARQRRGAAEASESVARTSAVPERQLAAWYEAARLWQEPDGPLAAPETDEVDLTVDIEDADEDGPDDESRALAALEAAAAIDVAHGDVFDRLSRIYAGRKMQAELAELLERRMDCVTDPDERIAIEVQRGRVLFEAGDAAGARHAYESALAQRPDDAQALAALTDLCLAQNDWEVAEHSLLRLARLLPTPAEQRVVYAQLGELYSHHLLNLPRAEVALKEVLKVAPDDADTSSKLVDVYKRQGDAPHALELQQDLVQKSQSPEEKRERIIDLALIYEETARDNRKAEQALETARREFPQDVSLLRALAAFYTRHHQTPAVNILLDRAGADARRALTAGRLTPASFEVLAAVFELRGNADGARVSRAMLATLEGAPVDLGGGGVEPAFDAKLDDLVAPEALTVPLRALLAKTGDALDGVSPIDLRALKATPIAVDGPIVRLVMRAAQAVGLANVNLFQSPKLGAVCIPVGSSPPTIVLGQSLLADERIGAFLALRALKLVRVNASALGRTVPGELGVLVSAWLKVLNPAWQPQGINPSSLTAPIGRIQAVLPKNTPPEVAALALEVASAIGTRQATLGPAALAWANRVAFLALGDPNAALDAIASAGAPGAIGVAGPPRTAPRDPKERAAWVARTPEARDLVAFAVTDAFAEARARLGLDR